MKILPNSGSQSKLVTAFFDVDETLLSIKTMFDFFDFWTTHQNLKDDKKKFDHAFQQARSEQQTRSVLNLMYYKFFAGHTLNELTQVGLEWFKANIEAKDLFIKKTLDRLLLHKNNGDRIVFVSGSMRPLLQPIADFLAVDDLLCIELAVNDLGILTGEITGIQTVGIGKAEAMNQFSLKNNCNLSTCYAYGDDISDMNMLLAVGYPVYVGEQLAMLEYAKQNQWQILN